MERASNPSGNLQAVKVLIDCGATTTPSSSIRIVESSDTTDIGKPEGTISGDSTARIEFRWKNDDTLIITGDTTGIYPWENSYQLKKRKGQISIVYEKKVIE